MANKKQKVGDWTEVPVKKLNKGWLPDMLRAEIPSGGFATLSNFKFLNQQLQKCLGYTNIGAQLGDAGVICFVLDWVAPNGNVYAYVGTTNAGAGQAANIYSMSRANGATTLMTTGAPLLAGGH